MKTALADGNGELTDIRRMATPHSRAEPGGVVVERIAALTAEYAGNHPERRIQGLGMTVPGLVDEVHGVGLYSANLGWRDFPFLDQVQTATGMPVAFGHDVGTAAEAEMARGAGRKLSDVVVMIIGTGVAGAVFSDGRRIRGGGYAGEIGHAQVPGGERCACGADGCLESVGSAGGITRRYQRKAGVPVAGAREVLELARGGDDVARQVWGGALAALAFSIRQFSAVLGSEAVIIGGGLAQAGNDLFGPLRKEMDRGLPHHRKPVVLGAELGPDAGLIGAAMLASRKTEPST